MEDKKSLKEKLKAHLPHKRGAEREADERHGRYWIYHPPGAFYH